MSHKTGIVLAIIMVANIALGQDIYQAINAGDVKAVTKMIRANPSLVDQHDSSGNSPLRIALDSSRNEISRLLVDTWFKSNVENRYNVDYIKTSQLHWAARLGNVEIAEALLRLGAQPELLDEFGKTGVECAHNENHFATAELLANHCKEKRWMDSIAKWFEMDHPSGWEIADWSNMEHEFPVHPAIAPEKSVRRHPMFKQLSELIQRNYMDRVPADSSLFVNDSSLEEVFSDLDPFSSYFTPSQAKAVKQELSGQFEGFGFQYEFHNDTPVVIMVMAHSPVERAGLEENDTIIRIDGKSVIGDSVFRGAVKCAREKGSATFTIARHGVDTFSVALQKETIMEEVVAKTAILGDDIGYMLVKSFPLIPFGGNGNFHEELVRLVCSGAKSIVIDLRNNGGGSVSTCVAIAQEFLPPHATITSLIGRKGNSDCLQSNATSVEHVAYRVGDSVVFTSEPLLDMSLIVLVNKHSASASELLSGAIQDLGRGIVVGQNTYGKGLFGDLHTLSDGSMIYLMAGRFTLASGRCLQKRFLGNKILDSVKPVRTKFYAKSSFHELPSQAGIIPDIIDSALANASQHDMQRFVPRLHAIVDSLRSMNSAPAQAMKTDQNMSFENGRNH